MEDRVEEKVENGSPSGSIPIALLPDHVPIMDTQIVSHMDTIVEALVVSSLMHDYIAMMDTKLVSPLTTVVDVDVAPPSIAAVDTCTISPLTTIGIGSPIVNHVVPKGHKHIALRIEEVADETGMDSSAKVVEGSIIQRETLRT